MQNNGITITLVVVATALLTLLALRVQVDTTPAGMSRERCCCTPASR